MRAIGEIGAVLYGCGLTVTIVGPNGARPSKLPCKTWGCRNCRPVLINKHKEDIHRSFNDLPCRQLFVGYREEKEKKLSNFISRNVKGHHCLIKGIDTSVIISDRKFVGSERRDKKIFLHEPLEEILNLPWENRQRVSYSKGFKAADVEPPASSYGIIIGDVASEFNKLRSPEDEAAWMVRQNILRLHKRGTEFLEKYLPVKPAADYRQVAAATVLPVVP